MRWGHHHSRQAHEALLALAPTMGTTTTERGTLLATKGRRGCSLPTGRLLWLVLLALLLLLLLLLRCRKSRRRRRWPNRLELPELTVATTCSNNSSSVNNNNNNSLPVGRLHPRRPRVASRVPLSVVVVAVVGGRASNA